jgi:lipoate-protein ligase A
LTLGEEWRIMGLDVYDAHMNMAIDEALCTLRSEEKSPTTLRLYRWKPSAVSIGYFQVVNEEVSLPVCEDLGIDVIRRMTGGGAVYHSYEGEITYSLIVNQSHPKIPADILESYKIICNGLILALRALGLPATFKPINDIEVNGKKISGNAQTRRRGVVVQHGTLLLDTDIRTMFRVLKVPKDKISDKMIKSVEDRVTTIKNELGHIDFTKVTEALQKGFEQVFDVKLVKGTLSHEERLLALKLKQEKYGTVDWTFKRPTRT